MTDEPDFTTSPTWGMSPELYAQVTAVLRPHGERLRRHAAVACIPIHGSIDSDACRVAMPGDEVTSVENIRAHLQRALVDPKVQAIMIDVASRGGSSPGIDALGDWIREKVRCTKPIVAWTGSFALSAAYWLASQATKVVATADAKVGSVGVILHLGDRGLDAAVIKSCPGKYSMRTQTRAGYACRAELSESERQDRRLKAQSELDGLHRLFVASVAAGRGVSPMRAERMGDGSKCGGQEAIERGFIDAVATRSQAIELALQLAHARGSNNESLGASPGTSPRGGVETNQNESKRDEPT